MNLVYLRLFASAQNLESFLHLQQRRRIRWVGQTGPRNSRSMSLWMMPRVRRSSCRRPVSTDYRGVMMGRRMLQYASSTDGFFPDLLRSQTLLGGVCRELPNGEEGAERRGLGRAESSHQVSRRRRNLAGQEEHRDRGQS